jgi:hypothetical protein
MQTSTPIDLRSLGYPECYVGPLNIELFETVPTISEYWEMYSSSRKGYTGDDMYKDLSHVDIISNTIGLPTLTHYRNNEKDIPKSWIGNRIFGLKGTVVHRDGDSVAPYLDCRDMNDVYIGFTRLKCELLDCDYFIAQPS